MLIIKSYSIYFRDVVFLLLNNNTPAVINTSTPIAPKIYTLYCFQNGCAVFSILLSAVPADAVPELSAEPIVFDDLVTCWLTLSVNFSKALGPSGFPFERFLSEILKADGWHTQTGVMMTGRCVTHEVDVLAEKAGRRVGIEAKFHNDPGGHTDIKDVLYVWARYEDLKKAPEAASRVDEGWLVTNTRFTRNAIRYASCNNLKLSTP